MSTLAPRALPENSSLAFAGERVRAAAAIPEALARRMLGTRNPHGRPSDEVVRRFVSAPTPRALREQWMVDFPPGMDEREAMLFVMPYEHLRRALGQATQGPWWMNPHARRDLRAALARVGRYLAAPAGGPPEFRWVESDLLPDDSLVVVARDDDWIAAVLASRAFALWWERHHTRRDPARNIATFPFPWAPDTSLNALSREREEARFALARAARGGDREAVESAVAAAYGWAADADDATLLARLAALHRERAG
jgi:hypothetical protein